MLEKTILPVKDNADDDELTIRAELVMARVGMEVVRRVRADERTRRISVTVLTSSQGEQNVLKSYNLGAHSYLRTPVRFAQSGIYWPMRHEASLA
jgi:CheY-like chemotaxis protein